jgi:hypothetical protein
MELVRMIGLEDMRSMAGNLGRETLFLEFSTSLLVLTYGRGARDGIAMSDSARTV